MYSSDRMHLSVSHNDTFDVIMEKYCGKADKDK